MFGHNANVLIQNLNILCNIYKYALRNLNILFKISVCLIIYIYIYILFFVYDRRDHRLHIHRQTMTSLVSPGCHSRHPKHRLHLHAAAGILEVRRVHGKIICPRRRHSQAASAECDNRYDQTKVEADALRYSICPQQRIKRK